MTLRAAVAAVFALGLAIAGGLGCVSPAPAAAKSLKAAKAANRGKVIYPPRAAYGARSGLAYTAQIRRGATAPRQPSYASIEGAAGCRIWLKAHVRCVDTSRTTAENRFVRGLVSIPPLSPDYELERELARAGVPVIDGVPPISIISKPEKSRGGY